MKSLKNFCLSLATANNEADVIEILKRERYWDNPNVWRYYGDNENNFAIIGDQQDSPDKAFVEKIINSVDAILMRECLRNGIDPEGTKAPRSLKDALIEFFKIREGILTNLDTETRNKLAHNIMLLATGEKSIPCYSIIDKGEGQTPRKMPNTFLSLTKSNKLRIPFVQGKFNMGGTGSIQFCGYNNIQLIISRRDPQIVSNEGDDGSSDYWGFTVIRREDPAGGVRSSTFKYLAPGDEVLMFKADSLPLLPGEYPVSYEMPLEWGTFIKLYEYQFPRALKTLINLDLNYRLALLLPNIALPVLLCERRLGYSAHTYHSILSGLTVRLEEDLYKNIEKGYPNSNTIKLRGQDIRIQKYVFKSGVKVEHYKKDEGIIFTVNGQAHGFISKSFYTRKSVGMSYLADSILLIADCSAFKGRTREDLFMNSRDRLRSIDLKKEIEEKLEDLIKNDQGLRDLRERRRREEIKGKIGNDKPLIEVIKKVIKTSPTLTKLFVKGVKIASPFHLIYSGIKEEEFKGKQFPTYFQLKKEFSKEKPKHCPVNHRFRVQFETNAENNYFARDVDPGEFNLFFSEGSIITDYTLNLWNGIANLTVELPDNAKIGNIIEFSAQVSDIRTVYPFLTKFYVVVDPPAKEYSGENGGRMKPPGMEKEGNRKKPPSALDIPHPWEIYQNEWEKHGFNRESALKIEYTNESGYDFFINMDNVYLLTELKGRINIDPEILKAKYKYGMVLLGLSLLLAFEKENEGDGEESIYSNISKITKALAPMLLPMITTLGQLEENQTF